MHNFSGQAPGVKEACDMIQKKNNVFHAFCYLRLEEALRESRALQSETPRSVLHNLPYSLKDMWDTKDIPTCGGSYRFRARIPEQSAPIYRALQDAGAVLLGKTTLSDLAMSLESGSYLGGVVKNPHNPTCTAGGSSGGAACAVATGMSVFDWGTDFGGSIRLPSAFCGVFGMRLSSESWPVEGMFPKIPPALCSLNGQGPITSDLAIMRAVLDVVRPVLQTGPTRDFSVKGVMVYPPKGVTARHWKTFSSDVFSALHPVIDDIQEVTGFPSQPEALTLAYAMYCSHFTDLLDADPIGFTEGFRSVLSSVFFQGAFGNKDFHPRTAEILLSLAVGSLFFQSRAKAIEAKNLFQQHVNSLWEKGYVIIMPTTTFPAPLHGGTKFRLFLPVFNFLGNLIDATALTIPFGTFDNQMPRAIQLWGPPGSENALLSFAEFLKVRVAGPLRLAIKDSEA